MKKNNKTYLLLAVVIGIWGVIAFKLLSGSNSESDRMTEVASNEVFVPKQLKQRDTFSLAVNYRDPFLGTIHAPKKVKKRTIKKTVKKAVPQKAISYTGFITDKSSKQKIFFVTIEGQQHLMGINETVQEVKLVRGTKDKIKVRCNGTTRTISLTK